MQRSLVENALPAVHLEVAVPEDVPSLQQAVQDAQDGLREDWNPGGRSAVLTVASGAHVWEKELHVLCNMSLGLVGQGFQGRAGGKSLGRWWLRAGSRGQAEDMYFAYSHPHRSPAALGVPMCHLAREMTPEDTMRWIEGRHPELDLDEEWDLVWATVDCWGAPWHFEQCSILASKATALACAANASASLYGCHIGGLNDDDDRAAQCVDLADGSRCRLQFCDLANTSSGGAGVTCTEEADARLESCFVGQVDFGIMVDEKASLAARDCVFRECIWATLFVGLYPSGASLVFRNNTVIGPGWGDERRPGRVDEADNIYDSECMQYRPWQQRTDERAARGIHENEMLTRVKGLRRRSRLRHVDDGVVRASAHVCLRCTCMHMHACFQNSELTHMCAHRPGVVGTLGRWRMKMNAQSSRRRRASESSTTQRGLATPSGSTPAADTATNPLMTTQPRAAQQPMARVRHTSKHLLVAMALKRL